MAADRVLQQGEDDDVSDNSTRVYKISQIEHRSNLDHSPHQLFIKLDELQGATWVEKAR